jgi:hypothetical protein
MVWGCIRLDYNAQWFIYLVTASRGAGGFPLELLRELLLLGFHGCNARVTVYRQVLHQGLTVSMLRGKR